MNKLAFLSSLKIPEFIREEYPLLVTFVNEYYRYVETLQKYQDIQDIDNTNATYLKLYKDTVGRGFADPEFLSLRNFIFSNKEFFSKKGTPAAFEFFFKAYFGEEIVIRTPNYLIASGGRISGAYYFYVSRVVGQIFDYDNLVISTNAGDVTLKVLRFVELDANTYAVYFNPPRGFINQIGNVVEVKNTNDLLTFRGTILPTPYRIVPVVPGKYWQLGQVIVLPSTGAGLPTIARVTRIDKNSGVAAIEVIMFGYPQTAIQYTISGKDSKPTGSIDFAELDIDNVSEGVYNYTLSLHDNAAGVVDNITNVQTTTGGGSYFNEDYQLEDYAGDVGFVGSSGVATVGGLSIDSPEYLESLAILRILTGPIARERYVYETEESLISNQNTKLHDNLFYQAFAYSIETTQNIEDYRGSIDLIHPAGMKFSAILSKVVDAINTTPSFELSGLHVEPVEATGSVGSVGFGHALSGNGATTAVGTVT